MGCNEWSKIQTFTTHNVRCVEEEGGDGKSKTQIGLNE